MITRIREVRRARGLTLDDVARACTPPTTPQTIGRLETGTRQLSLTWMNRIAAALAVDPELLVRGEQAPVPQLIARLGEHGADALTAPRDAVLPSQLGGANGTNGGVLVAMSVEASAGEYRAGDQLWLRQHGPEDYVRLLNRDVLAPRPGGRFAFGRMIDRDGLRVALLPPGAGTKQVIVENPAWLAVAEMLVRKL